MPVIRPEDLQQQGLTPMENPKIEPTAVQPTEVQTPAATVPTPTAVVPTPTPTPAQPVAVAATPAAVAPTATLPSFFASPSQLKDPKAMTFDERKAFQRFLNQSTGANLVEDGAIGAKTTAAWNEGAKQDIPQYMAQQGWISAPEQTKPATTAATMTGSINNSATNTKVTTTDVSGVQAQTMNMLKAMKDQGLTFADAFKRFYPQPTQNTDREKSIRAQQKAALFADALRLVAEGWGAKKGANVNVRDQRNPYASLQARLQQEYATYAKNMNDWRTKGVDAVMKDVQMGSDLYGKNLANAPKTTTETNDWNRQKFEEEQKRKSDEAAKARQFTASENAKNRANATQNAQIAHSNTQDKDPVYTSPNGDITIAKNAASSTLNQAFTLMKADPAKGQEAKDYEKNILANYALNSEIYKQKLSDYIEGTWHQYPDAAKYMQSKAKSSTYREAASPAAPQSPLVTPTIPTAKKTIPGVSPTQKKTIKGF